MDETTAMSASAPAYSQQVTSDYRAIFAALDKDAWPALPEKIEMSPATLHAVKEMAADAQTAVDLLRFTNPAIGVPVYVDPTVPNGQGRVTWQDGRVEYVGRAIQ